MQVNFYYYIGKNGSFDDICKYYRPTSEIDILKGINDREDRKDRKEFLIRLCDGYFINYYKACLLNIRIIIDYILDNANSDVNYGLWGACKGGHRDLVDLMIEKGANSWNCGLRCACEGGHIDLINLMIEKGADYWEYGLRGACAGGHLSVVKYMIKKGAHDFDTGLLYALLRNNWSVVEYLIILGSTKYVLKTTKEYYEYLANKLNKPRKQECHGIYEVLSDLVLLYQ